MNPHGIPVPDNVSATLRDSGVSRLIVTINGYSLRRALQGSKEFGSHIVVGLDLLRQAGAGLGDEVDVQIQQDPHPEHIDLCDELLIALEQDPEAMKKWESMTLGKKRSIAFHVSSAKREETRIKRALDIAMKLRTGSLHGD